MEKAQEESKVINVNTEAKAPDAETATEAKDAVKKPRGLIVPVIITLILAVAGVAFGVYGMLRPAEEPVAPGDIGQEEDQEAESVPSTAEVTKLLADKYNFTGTEVMFAGGLELMLDDFDMESKLAFVIGDGKVVDLASCDDYRDGSCVYVVSYATLNEKYHYYFGGEDLEKTDYKLHGYYGLSKVVYLSDTDEFEIYCKDGLGGYSTLYLLSKVDSVRTADRGYRATILTTEVNAQVDGDYDGSYSAGDDKWTNYVMISDEDLAKIQDSLSAYEFEFVVEGGESKLVNIRKI